MAYGDDGWVAAVTNDERPLNVPAQEPGMPPTEPLDGQGLTPSVMTLLMQQAKAMEAMAYTLDRMAAQNQDLMERLIGEDEEAEDHGHGVDMAGNPIKVS